MYLTMDTLALREKFGDLRGLELLKEHGFDGFDYTCYMTTPKSEMLGDDYLERAHAIREKKEALGLICEQAHAPFDFHYEDSESMDDPKYRRLWRSLEFAAIVGARTIVIHSVTVPAGVDLYDFNYDFYKKLEVEARRVGVRIGIENLFTYDRKTRAIIPKMYRPEDLNAFVERLGDWYDLCTDTGHAALTGYEPDEFLRKINRERMTCLHVQDTDYRRDLHTLPYCGDFDWDKILSALREIGYRGNINFETPNQMMKMPDELIPQALDLAAAIGRRFIRILEE